MEIAQYQRNTFGQLLRLAFHGSAVQSKVWMETLSSSSCICIWCRLLADFSRRIQHPRMTLNLTKNFARGRLEHSETKKKYHDAFVSAFELATQFWVCVKWGVFRLALAWKSADGTRFSSGVALNPQRNRLPVHSSPLSSRQTERVR